VRVHQNILTEGSLPIWMRRTYPALWAHPLVVWRRTMERSLDLWQDRRATTSTKEDLSAVGGELARLSVGETYFKDRNWVGEPFEIERSLGVEIEALPNTEITHCCRNGDAAWRGHSAKS
jgi:hypothetical protein